MTAPRASSDAPVVGTARWGGVRRPSSPSLVVAAILIAVTVLCIARDGLSVVSQAVLTGLLVGGVYSLVALGLALIFGVLGVLNFALGAFMTFGMYTSFVLWSELGWPVYATLPVTVVVMFAFGAVVQQLLINHSMGRPPENQLLITLGISLVIQNSLLLAFTATPRSVASGVDVVRVPVLAAVIETDRIVAFAGAAVTSALVFVLLNRTDFGMKIRAVADNATAAGLMGISARRVWVLTFALGTACLGVAAVLMLPTASLTPTTGEVYTVIAFVVVVLGGLGSIPGAAVCGLIVGVAQQLGALLFPTLSSMFTVYLVFLLILLFRPQGLFGERA